MSWAASGVPSGRDIQSRYGNPVAGIAGGNTSYGSSSSSTASDLMKALGGLLPSGGGTTKTTGTTGGGGGATTGGAKPIPTGTSTSTYTGTAATSPELKQALGSWDELKQDYRTQMEKAFDPTAAMAAANKAGEQQRQIAAANMGARGFGGGTGMTLSGQQKMRQQTAQDVAAAEIGAHNKGLDLQTGLLSGLSGAYQGAAGTASELERARLGAAGLAQDVWKTQLQDATERQRIAQQTAASQLSAILGLLGGLI